MCFIGFSSVTSTGGGGITTAQNLGNGAEVLARQTATTLDFRTLVAGTGIEITSTADEITIASNVNTSIFPLRNVLFVNTNGFAGIPIKGDITSPYQSYADALADFDASNGDVIWLLDDRDEVITLVEDIRIIGFNITLDNTTNVTNPDTITDDGVSVNAQLMGRFQVINTGGNGGSCTSLIGDSDLFIEAGITINAAIGIANFGSGSIQIQGNIKGEGTATSLLLGNNIEVRGNIINTSPSASICNFTVNFRLLGDLRNENISSSNVQVFSNNYVQHGKLFNAAPSGSGAFFLGGTGIEVYGNITETASDGGTFVVCNDVQIIGNITSLNTVYAGCTQVSHLGDITSQTGFCINGVTGLRLNGTIENFTPAYALAGGGIMNATDVIGQGYIHTNDSTLLSCTNVIWDGELFVESIQNANPEQACINQCNNVRLTGRLHADEGSIPFTHLSTNLKLNCTFIYDTTPLFSEQALFFAGGVLLIDSTTVLDNCTMDLSNASGNVNGFAIRSWAGDPIDVFIGGGFSITTNTGITPAITDNIDPNINFLEGFYKNYDSTLRHGLLSAPQTPVITGAQGTLVNASLPASIEINNANGLLLVNDQVNPAPNNFYGTNAIGEKGFFPLPTGGSTALVSPFDFIIPNTVPVGTISTMFTSREAPFPSGYPVATTGTTEIVGILFKAIIEAASQAATLVYRVFEFDTSLGIQRGVNMGSLLYENTTDFMTSTALAAQFYEGFNINLQANPIPVTPGFDIFVDIDTNFFSLTEVQSIVTVVNNL